MFTDDEMKKRGRRNSGLSQFGMQLQSLRGGRPGKSFMGVGSGGGLGSAASGFAFNRRQAPAMTLPNRPATGQSAPSMPQPPNPPPIDFTESDLTPDIASQVPASQTSPVSQPPQAPVSGGPVSMGAPQGGPMTMPPQGAQMGTRPGMPQLPSWMSGANPRPPGMPDWMFGPNPTPPGMNVPRR